MEKADEQQAAAEVGGFQVVFRIPGRVSLGASEGAKSLRISTATIAPDLAVRAVPVMDPTAFLEASFKQTEDAPLLPGRVAIYRDGVFVGRGQMAAAAKDETVRLGFGADDKIKIERTVVKRNEGSAGLIVTTSKTDERVVQDHRAQRPRFPDPDRDRGPVAGQRERGHRGRDAAVDDAADRDQSARQARRAGMGVRGEAGRGQGYQLRLAVRWPKDKGVVMVPAG